MSCCYSLTMLIQQYAEVLNYNLMWRNSNNTSGWPDNLKSGQIVRETPALTSYSGFTHLVLFFAVRIAIWRDTVCRIRIGKQPQDKSHAASGHMESSTSVYMLFHFCRMPRIWNLSLRNYSQTTYNNNNNNNNNNNIHSQVIMDYSSIIAIITSQVL